MKNILIGGALAIIILLLLFIASELPSRTVETVPVEKEVVVEPIPQEPTPRAPEPTPPPEQVTEPVPPPAGVDLAKVQPQEVLFWVNEIRVPDIVNPSYFIPIKESNIKTFAGSFGPYSQNPLPHLTVFLCAEMYKVEAAPSCEPMPLIYRDGYVSFARGYQHDEYIGGSAVKDYTAYFDILVNDVPVGHSPVAVIRTVKD